MSDSANFIKVRDHLEFIGYKINPIEPTEENLKQFPNRKQFVAEHKTKPNLFVTYNPDLGFNFNASYRVKPVAKDAHAVLFELLNKMNLGTYMAAFMINDTFESMYAISWMPDYYDRDSFNTFLDMFESDIRTSISNFPNVLDFVM